jgi:hypothetical protein
MKPAFSTVSTLFLGDIKIGVLDLMSTDRGVLTADWLWLLVGILWKTGMAINWLILKMISSRTPLILSGSMVNFVLSLTKDGYLANCEVIIKFSRMFLEGTSSSVLMSKLAYDLHFSWMY